MVSRQESKARALRRKQALKRYEKDRQRNVLAQPGPHEFVLILDQLKSGFNVPKIFRSAEAFGAHAVHLIDIGPFDPAPAKGSFRKVPARFCDSFAEAYDELQQQDYRFYTLEPDCPQPLTRAELPRRCAFILGNEELGISFERSQYAEIQCLSIPQYGSVESLNVSNAASIIMYEYVRQHGQGG